MSTKKITLKPKVRTSPDDAMNDWVKQGAETSAPAIKAAPEVKEPIKRLSIDLPASVHKDLMMYCAANGTKAAQVVRGLLEQLLQK